MRVAERRRTRHHYRRLRRGLCRPLPGLPRHRPHDSVRALRGRREAHPKGVFRVRRGRRHRRPDLRFVPEANRVSRRGRRPGGVDVTRRGGRFNRAPSDKAGKTTGRSETTGAQLTKQERARERTQAATTYSSLADPHSSCGYCYGPADAAGGSTRRPTTMDDMEHTTTRNGPISDRFYAGVDAFYAGGGCRVKSKFARRRDEVYAFYGFYAKILRGYACRARPRPPALARYAPLWVKTRVNRVKSGNSPPMSCDYRFTRPRKTASIRPPTRVKSEVAA